MDIPVHDNEASLFPNSSQDVICDLSRPNTHFHVAIQIRVNGGGIEEYHNFHYTNMSTALPARAVSTLSTLASCSTVLYLRGIHGLYNILCVSIVQYLIHRYCLCDIQYRNKDFKTARKTLFYNIKGNCNYYCSNVHTKIVSR
jgi:hypothetical protein